MASSRAPGDRELRNLGRRVAELRISRGLTQEGLAERLGKDARYVQEIEGGRQRHHCSHGRLARAETAGRQSSELFVVPTTRKTSGSQAGPDEEGPGEVAAVGLMPLAVERAAL